MESSGEVWLEIEILSHQHTGGFTARGLDGAPGERGKEARPRLGRTSLQLRRAAGTRPGGSRAVGTTGEGVSRRFPWPAFE